MKLTPEIVARLQTLQTLLELRDFDLLETVAIRMEPHRDHDGIGDILDAFMDHRYAEASTLVVKLLSEGTRLVRWTDPEIALLEAELEHFTAELAEVEAEQAETAHLLARFQAAFDRALGDRIEELLRLRMRMRQREAESDRDARESYEEAKNDYEHHRADQEARRGSAEATEWSLSEEERKELKRHYRAAAKRCHPDAVSEEHVEAAAAMFRDLNEAYQAGDLERVRKIAERAAAGLFEAVTSDDVPEKRKERLRDQIAAVREALAKARADLEVVKQSTTYRSATEAEDWEVYFEEQGRRLDDQIEQLSTMKA